MPLKLNLKRNTFIKACFLHLSNAKRVSTSASHCVMDFGAKFLSLFSTYILLPVSNKAIWFLLLGHCIEHQPQLPSVYIHDQNYKKKKVAAGLVEVEYWPNIQAES